MNLKTVFGIALIVLPLAFACKKDDEETTPAAETDNVELKIAHTWNGGTFQLNQMLVNPSNGDSLEFVTFKYYISNIRLKKADGSWWTQPDSYFLLDLSQQGSTATVSLSGVPKAEYTDIEYVLGVDSTHNVSGAQGGDLAPSLGMFWSWNTGYIMMKAEGISPDSGDGSFAYHYGGFYGPNSVVTTNTHSFGVNSLSVTGNGNCKVHLTAAPETLWSTIGSVTTLSGIHAPGANAKIMATDFHNSFAFDHIDE
jgi:hypothetical protein